MEALTVRTPLTEVHFFVIQFLLKKRKIYAFFHCAFWDKAKMIVDTQIIDFSWVECKWVRTDRAGRCSPPRDSWWARRCTVAGCRTSAPPHPTSTCRNNIDFRIKIIKTRFILQQKKRGGALRSTEKHVTDENKTWLLMSYSVTDNALCSLFSANAVHELAVLKY